MHHIGRNLGYIYTRLVKPLAPRRYPLQYHLNDLAIQRLDLAGILWRQLLW